MLVEAAKLNEIVPGGLKAVELSGEEIVLCNYEGKIYAISRRCGHMNAPLDLGALEGYILTCPMHHAQFDITTGEALSGPVPPNLGDEVIPEGIGKYMQYVGMLMSHIKTCNIKTYPVKIDKDLIKVEV
jgi:nitrite reductase/ring-hydroxylating ferredoxin subunit